MLEKFTKKDLEAAFDAGIDYNDSFEFGPTFEEWYKEYARKKERT